MSRFIIATIFAALSGASASAENVLTATTIVEPPYVTTTKAVPTSNEDFRGYIPDLLKKLSEQPGCDCRFNLTLVADGKYGVLDESTGGWSGMIGEVLRGEADLLAAPVTYSDIRARVINFTEHFMTFETVVLMKRTGSAERINSPVELSQHDDIQYGLVKDGFTENFFRRSGNQFYRDMYERMDKAQLPLTSADGVHKVQDSDGRYAFMIDSSTAEYWLNKAPCDLYSFRLGSALDCHKYTFAVKKDPRQHHNVNNLWSRLQRSLLALKRNGELERLKAKWWPHECSAAAAAAALNIIRYNALLIVISIVIIARSLI